VPRGPPTCALRCPYPIVCISNKEGVRGENEGVRGEDKGLKCSWWRGDGREALGGTGMGLKGGGVGTFPCFWRSANSSMSRATRAMTCSTGTPEVPSGI